HRVLEIPRPAFGEGERRVGHALDLHPLLGTGGGDGALEVAASLLGVEPLGGARAENRHRGRLVFGLALELLVGALVERLDRLHRPALLDPDLPLLGSHAGNSRVWPTGRGDPAPARAPKCPGAGPFAAGGEDVSAMLGACPAAAYIPPELAPPPRAVAPGPSRRGCACMRCSRWRSPAPAPRRRCRQDSARAHSEKAA